MFAVQIYGNLRFIEIVLNFAIPWVKLSHNRNLICCLAYEHARHFFRKIKRKTSFSPCQLRRHIIIIIIIIYHKRHIISKAENEQPQKWRDSDQTLGYVRLRNSAEILVLGPHLCTRIWVCTMIGLLKRPLLICQSGWEEIRNASGNWLSPLGAENKYFGAVSQTLLTGVRSRLRRRLANI